MTITLLLTKEDIVTTKNGLHYQIQTTDGTMINFTPEAVLEFMADIKALHTSMTPPAISGEQLNKVFAKAPKSRRL